MSPSPSPRKSVPKRKKTPPRAKARGKDPSGLTRGRERKPRTLPAPKGVIVGVGLSTVDMLCVAPRMGERIIELSVFSMQGGGTMGNSIATAAALGAKTRYFGRLGDDDFGRYIVRGLEEFDVDCSSVSVQQGALSPLSIVQIDELSRKRKTMTTRGSATALTAKDLPRGLLDGAVLLMIDGYQPALQAAIAEKARDRGIPILLNASHLQGGMGELLSLADIVIGSERFAAEFAPSDRIEQSLTEILRLGPHTAVITLGDAGAIGLHGDKLVQQEAVEVFVADSTGAGDVFCGAFAYAVLHGMPVERALPFANAAAGLCCRTIGARAGIATVDEVLELVDE